jgi:hypothetical protein
MGLTKEKRRSGAEYGAAAALLAALDVVMM